MRKGILLLCFLLCIALCACGEPSTAVITSSSETSTTEKKSEEHTTDSKTDETDPPITLSKADAARIVTAVADMRSRTDLPRAYSALQACSVTVMPEHTYKAFEIMAGVFTDTSNAVALTQTGEGFDKADPDYDVLMNADMSLIDLRVSVNDVSDLFELLADYVKNTMDPEIALIDHIRVTNLGTVIHAERTYSVENGSAAPMVSEDTFDILPSDYPDTVFGITFTDGSKEEYTVKTNRFTYAQTANNPDYSAYQRWYKELAGVPVSDIMKSCFDDTFYPVAMTPDLYFSQLGKQLGFGDKQVSEMVMTVDGAVIDTCSPVYTDGRITSMKHAVYDGGDIYESTFEYIYKAEYNYDVMQYVPGEGTFMLYSVSISESGRALRYDAQGYYVLNTYDEDGLLTASEMINYGSDEAVLSNTYKYMFDKSGNVLLYSDSEKSGTEMTELYVRDSSGRLTEFHKEAQADGVKTKDDVYFTEEELTEYTLDLE